MGHAGVTLHTHHFALCDMQKALRRIEPVEFASTLDQDEHFRFALNTDFMAPEKEVISRLPEPLSLASGRSSFVRPSLVHSARQATVKCVVERYE